MAVLRALPRVVRRVRSLPGRARTALSYFRAPALELGRWLITSSEDTNFTYDLSELNRGQLAAFVSVVTGAAFDRVTSFIAEIDDDTELQAHITGTTQRVASSAADAAPKYGRRIGWYAIARAIKPRVVVETGVDKGLGSVVLAAALRRNAADGAPGRYYGIDIAPNAGWLLTPPYTETGDILVGDAIETLGRIPTPIDLYVNDSDHSAAYESAEYVAAQPRLSPRAVVLGDNAHCTDSLMRFAHATGRHFLFFGEKPARHWYPGAGIGAAFP